MILDVFIKFLKEVTAAEPKAGFAGVMEITLKKELYLKLEADISKRKPGRGGPGPAYRVIPQQINLGGVLIKRSKEND